MANEHPADPVLAGFQHFVLAALAEYTDDDEHMGMSTADSWEDTSYCLSGPALARLLCDASAIPEGWPLIVRATVAGALRAAQSAHRVNGTTAAYAGKPPVTPDAVPPGDAEPTSHTPEGPWPPDGTAPVQGPFYP